MLKQFRTNRELQNSRLSEEEKYQTDEMGRGIIDVGAENYDDLFSYYNLNGKNVLDKEFDEFLEEKADSIPIEQELAIHFHIKNADEDKKNEIVKALRDNYIRDIRAINRKLNDAKKFSLTIFGFGLIFFIAMIVLQEYKILPDAIQPYIFSMVEIFTWICVWEAVDSFFLERSDLKFERLKKYRFVKAFIVVKEYKEPKTSKQKIIKLGNNSKKINLALSNRLTVNENNETQKPAKVITTTFDVADSNVLTKKTTKTTNKTDVKVQKTTTKTPKNEVKIQKTTTAPQQKKTQETKQVKITTKQTGYPANISKTNRVIAPKNLKDSTVTKVNQAKPITNRKILGK